MIGGGQPFARQPECGWVWGMGEGGHFNRGHNAYDTNNAEALYPNFPYAEISKTSRVRARKIADT